MLYKSTLYIPNKTQAHLLRNLSSRFMYDAESEYNYALYSKQHHQKFCNVKRAISHMDLMLMSKSRQGKYSPRIYSNLKILPLMNYYVVSLYDSELLYQQVKAIHDDFKQHKAAVRQYYGKDLEVDAILHQINTLKKTHGYREIVNEYDFIQKCLDRHNEKCKLNMDKAIVNFIRHQLSNYDVLYNKIMLLSFKHFNKVLSNNYLKYITFEAMLIKYPQYSEAINKAKCDLKYYTVLNKFFTTISN